MFDFKDRPDDDRQDARRYLLYGDWHMGKPPTEEQQKAARENLRRAADRIREQQRRDEARFLFNEIAQMGTVQRRLFNSNQATPKTATEVMMNDWYKNPNCFQPLTFSAYLTNYNIPKLALDTLRTVIEANNHHCPGPVSLQVPMFGNYVLETKCEKCNETIRVSWDATVLPEDPRFCIHIAAGNATCRKFLKPQELKRGQRVEMTWAGKQISGVVIGRVSELMVDRDVHDFNKNDWVVYIDSKQMDCGWEDKLGQQQKQWFRPSEDSNIILLEDRK